MRRGKVFFLCVVLSVALVFPISIFADNATKSLDSVIVESFDPEDRTTDWLVRGSKFISEGYPKQVYAKAWPEALWGSNSEGKNLEVLGINTKFDRQGYNSIEIIPVIDASVDDWEHNPIILDGLVQSIDCWVWGSNFNYEMEVHLMDHNGVAWVLPMGSLKFAGWKNLSTKIPSNIPQTSKHVPFYRNLTLQKLVVWTNPKEVVNDFYLYIDQIKLLSDIFVTRYDGDTLIQADKFEEMWGGE